MSVRGSLRNSVSEKQHANTRFVKQLIPQKWKQFMLQVLEDMRVHYTKNQNMINDLDTIVASVPQASFIQAALEIQPFKPDFQEEPYSNILVTESTVAEAITGTARFKGQFYNGSTKIVQKEKIKEKTLKHQFNREYHPYFFIFKNFGRLLELKYKQIIDLKSIRVLQIQRLLVEDMKIFTEFFIASSKPYKKLFKLEANQEQQKSLAKLVKFLQTYISEHQNLNNSLHKIILYATRAQLSGTFQDKIENSVSPDIFDIPCEFQIDGCYIRAMHSLMQFSSGSNSEKSMKKLVEFRSNILKDIDDYYSSNYGESRQLEMSAEIQIEVIRFIVAKLKGWACEIYAQLRYLQIVYGQEEIAYKYEEISFMYTQLTFAFEIIEGA